MSFQDRPQQQPRWTSPGINRDQLTPPPSAGWYQDPSGQPGDIYFDGRQWIHHRNSDSQVDGQPRHPHQQTDIPGSTGAQKSNANFDKWIAVPAVLIGGPILVVLGYWLCTYPFDPMHNAFYRQGYNSGVDYPQSAYGLTPNGWCDDLTHKVMSGELSADAKRFNEGCLAGAARVSH